MRAPVSREGSNRRTAGKLVVVTLVMFGFGFAMVPLYDVICDITGLNGKTASGPSAATQVTVDRERLVTIEFVAMNSAESRWEFRPQVHRMQVNPGQSQQVSFYARNLGTKERAAQAIPSVAPGLAAVHLKKTECFCFARQEFAAGEAKDMPVVFVLDPELPPGIETVTLSYTFYELEDQASAGGVAELGG